MIGHASRVGMLLLLVAVVAPGCNNQRASTDTGSKKDELASAAPAPAPPAAQPASADTMIKKAEPVAPAPKPKTDVRASATPRPKAAPAVVTLTVPAGTSVSASLVTPLSTATAKDGDSFVATTTEPIVVEGKTVIPAGAQIHGVLQDVQASGRIKGRAQMTLAFQQIDDSQGMAHTISADPVSLQAKGEAKGDAAKIAGGGLAGALVGGLAKGKKGALIGTAIGAGAGTALVLATKGDEVELAAGQALSVRTTAPLSVTVAAK
ncbi:MAG: hypothetical protein U0167_06805 [bacterium]